MNGYTQQLCHSDPKDVHNDEEKILQAFFADTKSTTNDLQLDSYFNFDTNSQAYDPNQHSENSYSIYQELEPSASLDLGSASYRDDQSLESGRSLSELNSTSRKITKTSTACTDRTRRHITGIRSETVTTTTMKNNQILLRRSPWTLKEDTQVQDLVSSLGERWSAIARVIGNRTGKQVRDRYNNFLRPNIIHTELTEDEDAMLLELVAKLGPRWARIAAKMPGRTEYQVKNRCHGILREQYSSICDRKATMISNNAEKKRKEGAESNVEATETTEKQTDDASLCHRKNKDHGTTNGTNDHKIPIPDPKRLKRKKELLQEVTAIQGFYRQVMKELKALEDM